MTERLRLWQDRITTEVEVVGSGPPLLYLHGPWGLSPDLAYVQALSASHTVYAPRYPGTTPGDPEAIHQLDSLLDLVTYHAELLDRLELRSATVVGHSVGGMLACEIGAAMPERVERLVLMDAPGLWRDDQPVRNWMIMPEDALRAALFADPPGDVANAFFAQPAQPEPRADRIWALACTAKFIWPIPDIGLHRRIHRVRAPTLLIWGAQDGIVPPVYAEEFGQRIAGAQTAFVEGAGHLPHLEQPTAVVNSLNTFLARGGAS
ncbi:MAG TPA: alpha/beta fold hydrolase [Chloroflexota bacterium]|jgi:pimeloyl-ACP methyl ester carboxylesterase